MYCELSNLSMVPSAKNDWQPAKQCNINLNPTAYNIASQTTVQQSVRLWGV